MLNPFNFRLKHLSSLRAERAYYGRVISGLEALNKIRIGSATITINTLTEGLVFSKDRPMQLHALLTSYFQRAFNPAPLTVLFKCTDNGFRDCYEELMQEMEGFPVRFVEENHFYQQVVKWVELIKADRIFFMTDDAIILDDFDFNDMLLFNPLDTVFSLTKGMDLTYCFNHNCQQDLPDFKKISNSNNGRPLLLQWEWEDLKRSPDWSYPLSLDATFFFREEMKAMLDYTRFHNPNSMEAGLQVFVNAFLPRKGACYTKAKYVNVPCNLVQSDFRNRTTGAFTVEELKQWWLSGKRIDIQKFWKQDSNVAQKMKFEFR
jgi:hypothetical protein